MEKIKALWKKRSLKSTFMLYLLVTVFVGVNVGALLEHCLTRWQVHILRPYFEQYTSGNVQENTPPESLEGDIIEFYWDNVDLSQEFDRISAEDTRLLTVLDYFRYLSWLLSMLLSAKLASMLFFRQNLAQPLRILEDAINHISQNDLDFQIDYKKNDEMGRLCQSFETMRHDLAEVHQETWRQMEEQQRLNAIFAHDLRTPLTVVKGQIDLLQQYHEKMSPEKCQKTFLTLQNHISRLEDYVEVMHSIQSIEARMLQREDVPHAVLVEQVRLTGQMLAQDLQFSLHDETAGIDEHWLDFSLLLQVYENLLSNARRFAKHKITVFLCHDGFLQLTVCDDGAGFPPAEMQDLTRPFYRSLGEADNVHLGMGLHSSQVLCEKHQGRLLLYNNAEGACAQASFQTRRPQSSRNNETETCK